MDKCKACGKFKLFSKFEKGLCSTCLNKLFPANEGAFGLTKDMFLNPEKYTVKEDPIRREKNLIPEGYFTDTDGRKIPISSVHFPFDPSGLMHIDHNFYEITSPDNIDIAKDFIMSLNSCLNDASAARNDFPAHRFVRNRLNFKFDPCVSSRNYCTVSFQRVSANNVPLHCKCRLGIHYTDDLFGEIIWDQDGSLDGAKLTLWQRSRTVYPDRIECGGDCYVVMALPSESGLFSLQSVKTRAEIDRDRAEKSNSWKSVHKKWQSVIDKHQSLTNQINSAYSAASKTGFLDGPDVQHLINLCVMDISIAEKFTKAQTEIQNVRIANGWTDLGKSTKGIKTYPSFKKLAIIYEKQRKYNEAIAVCQNAIELGYISDGTAGQMPGRIAKLKQKASKLSSPAAK